ncbi:DUF1850 domain-containing protein [Brevibacterium album]|uniref:DUF1850 domain-containing protein n=1 Tax=Brevibacterium album TaxID=417948 RepID=UPI0003FC587F|nr:DUF1850 domain-containing protein [Brevibacterium album]
MPAARTKATQTGSDSGPGAAHRGPATVSRRLLLRGGAAAAGALVAGTAAGLVGCSSGPALVCRHQRTGEEYARLPLEAGSRITHSWVHSIERSRWTDTFEYDGESLRLVATKFKEYGAGMPLDEGTVRLEDGWVSIEDIDREFEAVRWIHSHRVDYRIGIDGDEDLLDPLALPDREPLELRPL